MSVGSHFQARRTFLKAAGLTLLGAHLVVWKKLPIRAFVGTILMGL